MSRRARLALVVRITAADGADGTSGLVALVTATVARHLDEDLPPCAAALERAGIPHAIEVWDDPAVDWSSYELIVVRSAWDYHARYDEFLAWCDRVAAVSTVCNSVPIIRWNTDKRYLRDLQQAGAPVTPTIFHEPGHPVHVPPIEVVVKPAVSAGATDTERYAPEQRDEAVAHVERLLAQGRVAMVQPYMSDVDSYGETALVFFDGVYSHAIRKGPILLPEVGRVEGLYAEEDISVREPTAAEFAAAERVLAAVPPELGTPLYARVDLVPGPEGAPVLLELELAEPSLFVFTDEAAPDRFAAVVGHRLSRS
jgi:hypothetical protein